MKRKANRDEPKKEPSAIDFFEISKEIQNSVSNKKEVDDLFNKILNHENYSTSSQSYEVISSRIKKISKQNHLPADFNVITFKKYVALYNDTMAPSSFGQFLFFVQLYSIGKISHTTFVNLILNLLSSDSEKKKNLTNLPHIKLLPSFMSIFNNPSISKVGVQKGTKIDDFCSEIIVGLTSYAENNSTESVNLRKILFKCLQGLGMGIISLDNAKFWLSQYFPPEYFSKLDQIHDYKLILPSQFPHEIIGCSDFESNCKLTAAQIFVKDGIHKYSMLSLSPVAAEVFEKKLQLIFKILNKIRNREKIDSNELSPIFGDEFVPDVLEKTPALKEISYLSQKFNEIKDELSFYLNQYIQNTLNSPCVNYHFDFDNNEYNPQKNEETIYSNYRYIYNIYLRPLNFFRVYEIPGTKKITFGSLHQAFVAIALVHKFITVYFRNETVNHLLAAFSGLMPLFKKNENFKKNPNGRLVCNGNKSLSSCQIAVLAYLSEVNRAILNYADVDLIKIKNNADEGSLDAFPVFDEDDCEEDEMELFSIPTVLKSGEKLKFIEKVDTNQASENLISGMRASAYLIQSIDMVLTLLVQHLAKSAKNGELTLLNTAAQLKAKRIVPIVKECAFENDDASIVISVITSLFS